MNYLHRIIRHTQVYMALSAMLVLLAMSVAAWQYNLGMDKEREAPFASAVASYADTVEGGTIDSRAMGAAILFGLENREAKQLLAGKLPSAEPAVRAALDVMRAQYIADAAFLVDEQGVVVSSSSLDNARGAGSGFSLLPYVQLAARGTPSVYPAVSGGDRGIYLAAPVRATMDDASRVIGAVVVKVGAEKLDRLLESWKDGIAVLVSPQGVTFASSRKGWLFRITGDAGVAPLAEIRHSGQFGEAVREIAPLPFALNSAEANIDGVRYAVLSRTLDWNDPAGDWRLGLLERRVAWWSRGGVLGAAGLAGLFAATVLFWLYTLARHTFARHEDYLQLESAQTRLRVSEARLHAILDNSPVGIWLVGVDGRYRFVNKTFCNAVGIPESAFLATRNLADIMEPSAAANCLKSDRECLGKDGPHQSHEMLTLVDGKQHLLEITKVKIHDDAGKVTGVVGISMDITEREQAEGARKAALEFLQKITRQVPGVVYQFRLSPDGKPSIPYASDAIREIYRLSPEDVREDASVAFSLVHPDDMDGFMASIRESAKNMSPWQHEYRLKFSDGTERWLFGNSLPQCEANGSVIWHGFITDITERKRVEEVLRESMAKAEAATRAKSEFLANISHELRTPMNSILGMAHLALNAETDPKKRGYLEKIHFSGTHLLEIIDEVLDFSKIDANKLRVECVDFDLDSVMGKLHNMVAIRAMEKGLKLEFDIDPGIPNRLRGDPRRLGQVLLNYAGNAIKFTAAGGITVRARKLAECERSVHVRFEVQDTGIGISDEDKAKLFQPFQQVDASITRNYGGTGLGLAISKQLVEMMDESLGKVGVDSVPGRGSTFWFSLGFGKSSSIGSAARDAGERMLSAMPGNLRGAHVLVVENNLFNQQVASEILENAGIVVCVAQNGREAIDLLLKNRFDCVLMDVQMPVMDGIEATRLIRANPALAGVPVIAMTANAADEDRARCMAAGMDDYISKPFKPAMLYAVLARWLPGREAQAPVAVATTVSSLWAGDPEIIDLSVLAELIGEDRRGEMRRFVNNFMELARNSMTDIGSALERNDLDALRTLGHHNKAPARMVGAMGFAGLCQSLEDLGKNGEGIEQARGIVGRMYLLLDRIDEKIARDLALAPVTEGRG